MRFSFRRLAALLLTVHCSLLTANAQAPKSYTSSEILLGLKKLNVLGSVLYIAAHPDDENTRLLAYLANERLVETAYLSCTRGDGGQNLIGPELREQLGVIRTQELLAARRIDGAEQFFTRANDFGFSKTSDETFTIWDKEQVLADMVWVIRQRRPDVLITRFPPDARAGHGHHQASAILAAEAFDAAGDPKRFPEQLKYVQVWQPKRLLWNTGSFFVKPGEDMSGYLKLDTGSYNPLLGKSYGELAALSRSQHRSQGMGTAAQRGESIEYFQLVKGAPVSKDILEGVDLSWNRVPGGAAVGKAVEEVIKKFDPGNPSASVPSLAKAFLEMRGLQSKAGNQLSDKLGEAASLLQACTGLSLEATTSEATVTPGSTIQVKLELINRSAVPVSLLGLYSNFYVRDSSLYRARTKNMLDGPPDMSEQLLPGKTFSKTIPIEIAGTQPVSQPYWLREPPRVGMYTLPSSFDNGPMRYRGALSGISADGIRLQDWLGKPGNPPVGYFYADLGVQYAANRGTQILYTIPIQYKHTDPTLGELYQPLAVVPPVMLNLPAARAYVFSDAEPKTVPVTLRAGKAGVSGSLALQVPKGWEVSPATATFNLKGKDEEQTVSFSVKPGKDAAAGHSELKAMATVDGQQYGRGIQTINYPHIPTQTLFPEASSPLVKLNVSRGKTQTVGYLMGAGDEVPEALRQLGYTVTLLDPNTDLSLERLRRFDAVVLGIRAYNTLEQLKTRQPELLKYVEQGGNLVVQYVVTRGALLPQIGPYPLTLSNDRVTVENAPVTFLKPEHPLLNKPNKITAEDFKGWVQEQGLYYPSAWDAKYTPIISSADPGEKAKESAILVADYGKGHYIYTGLSFFRELPAGVPGAYRILANLVSYGR